MLKGAFSDGMLTLERQVGNIEIDLSGISSIDNAVVTIFGLKADRDYTGGSAQYPYAYEVTKTLSTASGGKAACVIYCGVGSVGRNDIASSSYNPSAVQWIVDGNIEGPSNLTGNITLTPQRTYIDLNSCTSDYMYEYDLSQISTDEDIILPIINCEFAEPIINIENNGSYYSIEGKRPHLLFYPGTFNIEVNLNV